MQCINPENRMRNIQHIRFWIGFSPVCLLFCYINTNVSPSLFHCECVPNHKPGSLYRPHKHHHKLFIIISPPVTKPHTLITKHQPRLSVICLLCIHTPCSPYRPDEHILNVSLHCGYIVKCSLYALHRPNNYFLKCLSTLEVPHTDC